MKKLLIILTAMYFTAGCASMNKTFNSIPNVDQYKQQTQFKGKTPKEVSSVLGEPVSVGWWQTDSRGKTTYFLAYPVGEGTVTTLDIVTGGDNLTCRVFEFQKDNGFKFGNDLPMDTRCSALKISHIVYDDSMVK